MTLNWRGMPLLRSTDSEKRASCRLLRRDANSATALRRKKTREAINLAGYLYTHLCQQIKVVCPEGIEPPTHSLEGCCSIQLSYGQRSREIDGRGERIRTFDPLVPNQMRYQAALRPDLCLL
jgi:hypothetical protein